MNVVYKLHKTMTAEATNQLPKFLIIYKIMCDIPGINDSKNYPACLKSS